MYNDFVGSTNREGWKYNYFAKDLLPYAKAKYTQYLTLELAGRNKMAELMQDMNKSQSDPEVDRTKREIENNGKLREQCAVFVHEFSRIEDREYHLSLGDVTFFEIVNTPSKEELAKAREEIKFLGVKK